jgi:hypothetical protein
MVAEEVVAAAAGANVSAPSATELGEGTDVVLLALAANAF